MLVCCRRAGATAWFGLARRFSAAAGTAPAGKYEFVDPNRPELFVKTSADLADVVKALEPHPVIGIDTEFLTMPFYRPNLEVFQISTPEIMVAIDCQRLKPQLGPLLETINSKEVIIHSCTADFQILVDLSTSLKLSRKLPVKVFDTQVAAAYLGYGPMCAFKKLLGDLFGVEMDKKDTLTDWSKRPLTPDQIKYAINDVRHLHAIREHLTKELVDAGRQEWADIEMRSLSNPRFFSAPEPKDAWRHIFPTKKLGSGSTELSVAKEIAEWRESLAAAKNFMPGFILRNEAVVGIASLQPTEAEQLGNIQGIKPRTLRENSRQLLAAVKRGVEMPEELRPTHRLSHKDGGRLKEGLFNLLNSRVHSMARPLDMSPFAMAPRHELFDLASVSPGAIERVLAMPAEAFKPLDTPSNVFGLRWELLPPAFNTAPAAAFANRSEVEPVTVGDHTIVDPFTEDDEVEMLLKLKVLSGWRRELVGSDLLKIAQGNSLAWDEGSLVSQIQDRQLHLATGPARDLAVKRVDGWVEKMTKEDKDTLNGIIVLIQERLGQPSAKADEAPSKEGVGQLLDKLEGVHGEVRRAG